MKSKTLLKWFPIGALVPLAIYVLVTPYDPLVNRIAVAAMLLATGGGFAWINLRLIKRHGIFLSWFSPWLLAFAAAEDAIGNFLYWYEAWHGYDDLGHVVGTLVVTVFVLEILFNLNQKKEWKLPAFHLGVYAVSLSMLVAVMYEISELIGDAFFGTYRITSRLDSAMDLMWGFVGSLLAVGLWRALYLLKKKS